MKHLLIGLISTVLLAQPHVQAQTAASPTAPTALKKKTELYVGTGTPQNGVVSTIKQHLGSTTAPIGYSVDDASAVPATDFIEIFVGSDTANNGVVSKNPNHAGGSTTSVGYLSLKPIPGGTKLYSGSGPCNNGVATNNTKHAGCNTEPLGYTLPLTWPN